MPWKLTKLRRRGTGLSISSPLHVRNFHPAVAAAGLLLVTKIAGTLGSFEGDTRHTLAAARITGPPVDNSGGGFSRPRRRRRRDEVLFARRLRLLGCWGFLVSL